MKHGTETVPTRRVKAPSATKGGESAERGGAARNADQKDGGRKVPGAQMAEERTAEKPSAVYGYARVSSRDQNLARQLDALRSFPVSDGNIFRDKASGKDFDRPGYRRLLRRLRPGDVLVIKSIDRLGRNYSEILDEWRALTQKKHVAIVVLDMPLLDTRGTRGDVTDVFIADMVLQLLSYVSQVERENTKQRQAEGIAAARARGVRFGRPRIERPEGFARIREAYREGLITRREASRRCGVSVRTFDSWIKHDEKGTLS